jgi:hypothetical protein
MAPKKKASGNIKLESPKSWSKRSEEYEPKSPTELCTTAPAVSVLNEGSKELNVKRDIAVTIDRTRNTTPSMSFFENSILLCPQMPIIERKAGARQKFI